MWSKTKKTRTHVDGLQYDHLSWLVGFCFQMMYKVPTFDDRLFVWQREWNPQYLQLSKWAVVACRGTRKNHSSIRITSIKLTFIIPNFNGTVEIHWIAKNRCTVYILETCQISWINQKFDRNYTWIMIIIIIIIT